MTTRSTQLWSTGLVGRPSGVLYTVGPNRVVLLKSVLVRWYGGVEGNVQVRVINAAQTASCAVVQHAIVQDETVEWNGWVVLLPGDVVQATWDTGQVYTFGSGAILPPYSS